MKKDKEKENEAIYIIRAKRILSHFPGPPDDADIIRYACRTNYSFRFCHHHRSKECKSSCAGFLKDVSTRQIIDKLDASDYFNVNKILYDNNEIEETLRKSSSDLIIVFEAGFDNNLRHTGKARVQLIADATDPNNATILTSYASNIIADYQQSRIMQQQSPIQIIPK